MTYVIRFDNFKAYYRLSAGLIKTLSRKELADSLKILALHTAHYRARFREIPGNDLAAAIRSGGPLV